VHSPPTRSRATVRPAPARIAGDVPGQEALRSLERAENFPVALRLLPRDLRADLRAVYDVVRTIDHLGDEAPGDRSAALHAFAVDLAEVWSGGQPAAPVLAALAPAVARRGLPQEPFDRLVTANLWDQQVCRYARFSDLEDYCALSAAPIGRLVLAVFGVATPERIALSDRVCAGLQVVEHLQDIAEDRRAGRVYLPQEDMAAHGVREHDLDAAAAPPALRRLVHAELERVTGLLAAGRPLLADLSGWARLAVAGYLAGGLAAVDGIRRLDGDVLARRPEVRRRDLLRHLLAGLARRPSTASPGAV
jgi:squalene synthase HpnC